jgi:hypothetical protein
MSARTPFVLGSPIVGGVGAGANEGGGAPAWQSLGVDALVIPPFKSKLAPEGSGQKEGGSASEVVPGKLKRGVSSREEHRDVRESL